VSMPSVLGRQPLDVHHGPHYTMPERTRLPVVVTVHDLTFFDHPQWHERAKVPFFRRAIRQAAARAKVVVCVSDATARRLDELLHPGARVVVAHHGIDHDHFLPADHPSVSVEEDRAVLHGYGIRPPYVAFLGTLEPRKGIDLLASAFDRVAPAHPELQLVIAGGRGWSAGDTENALAAMRHSGRLVRTGYLSDDVVPVLLRRSACVVYPARAEGFGLPVIEALASGAPVITTAGSVMDELAAGTALTFPSEDVSALAEVLAAALDAPGHQESRRRAGLKVAARYTWAASAEEHVSAYRLAAS
jgi:glycosyltransferase involved in cell wall biosynthesis